MCTEHITSLDKIPYKPFRRRGPVPNVPWKIRNSETPTRVSFRPKNLDFYRQHNSEIHLLPHNSRHKTATGNPQRITTIRKPFNFPHNYNTPRDLENPQPNILWKQVNHARSSHKEYKTLYKI